MPSLMSGPLRERYGFGNPGEPLTRAIPLKACWIGLGLGRLEGDPEERGHIGGQGRADWLTGGRREEQEEAGGIQEDDKSKRQGSEESGNG